MSLDKLENYLDTEIKRLRLLEDSKEMVVAIKNHKRDALEANMVRAEAIKEKEVIAKENESAKAELAAIKKAIADAKVKAEYAGKDTVAKAEQAAQQIHACAVLAADAVALASKEIEKKCVVSQEKLDALEMKLADTSKKWAALDSKIKALAAG